MTKRYSREIKEEVLSKIRSGRRVSAMSAEYGIKEGTVRSWLTSEAGKSKELLEVSRLRRENEALLRLVGQLTFEAERGKKSRSR